MADGFGRWLLIGCGGLLVLGCAGGGITGGVLLGTLRRSDAFAAAEAWVHQSPAVIERVGEPVETGWFPQGSISPMDNGDRTAEFTHHASGPRGEVTVHTNLLYRDGQWLVGRASVDEGGRPVVLPVGPEGEAATGTADASTVHVAEELAAAATAYAEARDADAIAAAEKVIDVDPTHAEAHYWRGRAEARQGDLERAAADFEAAVAHRPDYADAWEGLAYANARAGHDPEAIAALDRLITLRPNDGKALADRANARYRTGDRAGARADAQASCEQHHQPGCDLEARLAKMGG